MLEGTCGNLVTRYSGSSMGPGAFGPRRGARQVECGKLATERGGRYCLRCANRLAKQHAEALRGLAAKARREHSDGGHDGGASGCWRHHCVKCSDLANGPERAITDAANTTGGR